MFSFEKSMHLSLKGPIHDSDLQSQSEPSTAVAVAVDGLPTHAATDLFNLSQFILINIITYLLEIGIFDGNLQAIKKVRIMVRRDCILYFLFSIRPGQRFQY